MPIPKEVLDCTVVKDPEDPDHFRMKYTVMASKGKETRFCDAGIDPYLFIKRSDKWILKGREDKIRGTHDNGEYIGFKEEELLKIEMSGPLQVREFRDLLESKFNVLTYECYSQDTKILTEEGFKYFFELTETDKVATLVEGRLEFEYPLDRQSYEFNGDMVRIKTKFLDALVTPNHNMYVKNPNWNEYRTVQALDIVGKSNLIYKRNMEWTGREVSTFVPRGIRVSKSGTEKILNSIPMDVWLEILGWYLSEGSTDINKVVFSIYNETEEREVSALLSYFGIESTINKGRVIVYSKHLSQQFKCFGKAHDKYIPSYVYELSKRQIMIFLETLFSGDGNFNSDGSFRSYTTVSSSLADGVKSLLLRVGFGYTSWMKKTEGHYINGRWCKESLAHVVGVSTKRSLETKPRTSVPEYQKYSGNVYCVTTSTGLVFVERNGKGFWCGNSDIPFVRRWFIDQGIRQPALDKILYVDIEVDSRKQFSTPQFPEGQIISIAAVGSDGKEFFICNRDERYVLKLFYNLVASKYEVITGWNFCGDVMYGVPFDWPYILARTKKLNLRRQFIPIQQMDAYRAYLRFTDFETKGVSNSLDAVSQRVLGIGKTGKYDADKAWDSLVNDPEHKWLYTYNMQDARLVKELDEKLKILNPYIVFATKLPVFLRDLDKMSIVWEAMLLDRCFHQNPRPIFPRKRMTKFGDVKGALTFLPIPGVHDDVMVVDYAGLYIAVMLLIGISPEMVSSFQKMLIDEEGIDPDAMMRPIFVTTEVVRKYVKFVQSKDEEPLYKAILQNLSDARTEEKKMRKASPEGSFEYHYHDAAQKFMKEVLVSGYGVQGLKKKKKKEGLSRFHSPLMGNLITFPSRQIQGWTKQYFESRGWTVTYGDTDSVFITKEGLSWLELGADAEKTAKECTFHVREWISQLYGIDDVSFLNIKAEKIFSELIHGQELQKKRYVGWKVWDEDFGFIERKWHVTGAEQKRSDSFELMKEVEEEIMRLMFKYRNEGRFHVDNYMKRIRRKLFDSVGNEELKREMYSKLIIEKGMNKPPQEYATGSQLRRIAEELLRRKEYRPGERVRWLQISDKPRKLEYPLGPEWDIDDVHIDYSGFNYYYDRLDKMVDRWVPSALEQTELEMFSS